MFNIESFVCNLRFISRLSSDPRFRGKRPNPPCGVTESFEIIFLLCFVFDLVVKVGCLWLGCLLITVLLTSKFLILSEIIFSGSFRSQSMVGSLLGFNFLILVYIWFFNFYNVNSFELVVCLFSLLAFFLLLIISINL